MMTFKTRITTTDDQPTCPDTMSGSDIRAQAGEPPLNMTVSDLFLCGTSLIASTYAPIFVAEVILPDLYESNNTKPSSKTPEPTRRGVRNSYTRKRSIHLQGVDVVPMDDVFWVNNVFA